MTIEAIFKVVCSRKECQSREVFECLEEFKSVKEALGFLKEEEGWIIKKDAQYCSSICEFKAENGLEFLKEIPKGFMFKDVNGNECIHLDNECCVIHYSKPPSWDFFNYEIEFEEDIEWFKYLNSIWEEAKKEKK